MKRLLVIVIIAISGSSSAEQSCRQNADTGKAICVGGVLYRCACRDVSGSTLCSWNNAASACSALSSREDSSEAGVVRESRRAP
jgi:hypothetical protein